jgi:hypothetical protein
MKHISCPVHIFQINRSKAYISELLRYGYISELVHSAVKSSLPNTYDYISPFLVDFPYFEKKLAYVISMLCIPLSTCGWENQSL